VHTEPGRREAAADALRQAGGKSVSRRYEEAEEVEG